jgi:hypothetical protein
MIEVLGQMVRSVPPEIGEASLHHHIAAEIAEL